MILNNIVSKTLSNGLKVICLRKTGAPIVSLQVWYKVGSICEEDGIRGLSHFLEHMMFRGSKNVASEVHARRINYVGGHCNAFTTEDVTAYVDSAPKEFLDMMLELEADRMDGLLLDSGLFNTERKVIIEEFHTYMNNPVAKAFLEFRQEFFKNHPYMLSPLGKLDDLQVVTNLQCEQYYKKWYSPSNAVVVVVGDIVENEVLTKVEQLFGNKAGYQVPSINGKKDTNGTDTSKLRMKRKVDFDVPLLVMGFPAPAATHQDAVAMEILQAVIAGGESSRLQREVVRKDAVAVMAGGTNQMLKYAGMSMFFAAFTPDISAAKVEKSISRQIKLICENGITDKEIEKVKNSTLASRTFELYSAENICNRIAYSECFEGNYMRWVERLDALKNLNSERLVEVAKRYWNDSELHVLHLQPKKIKPMLYIGGLLRRLLGKRF
jgi:zinc protease